MIHTYARPDGTRATITEWGDGTYAGELVESNGLDLIIERDFDTLDEATQWAQTYGLDRRGA